MSLQIVEGLTITWSGSPAQPDYRPCQSGERSLQAKGCSLDRIPKETHFRPNQEDIAPWHRSSDHEYDPSQVPS